MLISVVVPCYNCALTIERTIRSVLMQSHQNWELILVNNNSSDNTLDIISMFPKQYPDKIRVVTETKKGAAFARNTGLSLASGDWVQFLDADDELWGEKFKKSLTLIYNNLDIDVICAEAVFIKREKREKRDVDKDIWLGLIRSRLGITSANLFKRDTLLKVGGWDEEKTSSQEYELMFRLLKSGGRFFLCNTVMALIHTDNPHSVSRDKEAKKAVQILDNSINLRLEIRKHLNSIDALDRERNVAISKFIRNNIVYFLPYSKWKILMRLVKLLPVLIPRDIFIIFSLLPLSLIKNKR